LSSKMRLQGLLLAAAVGSVATQDTSREPAVGGCFTISQADCCKFVDGRADKFAGQLCVPSAEGEKFFSGNGCEPSCLVDGTGCDGQGQDDTAKMGQCALPTTTPSPTTTTPAVTTTTPWDSSASSSGNSNSLDSACSSSFRKPWDSSTSSTDSSTDSSDSAASGSSGCYPSLPIWPFLCCPLIPLCLAPLIPMLKPKPRPKPKKRAEPKAPAPPEPLPEVVLPTTTIPVQSYVAAPSLQFPVTTSYQQPLMQPPLMTTAVPMQSVETVLPMQSAPMPLLGTASLQTATPVLGGTAMPAYSAVAGMPPGGVY